MSDALDTSMEPGYAACYGCHGTGEVLLAPCDLCNHTGYLSIGIGWGVWAEQDPETDLDARGGIVVDTLTADVDTETGEIITNLRYVTLRAHRRTIAHDIVTAAEAAENPNPPNTARIAGLVQEIHRFLGKTKPDRLWLLQLGEYAHRLTVFLANDMKP